MKAPAFEFRGSTWDFSDPLIMGVLNLTPDSFSDGACYPTIKDALTQADRLLKEGADVLDVGGESTRPRAGKVSADEELARILPVIEAVAKRHCVPISVDTYKSEVAQRAVDAGAELINDVSGGLFDSKMFAVADALGVAYICGHVRGQTLSEVHEGQCDQASVVAQELGIRLAAMPANMRGRVIVDPCLGFGKSLPCNIELMHGGGTLREHLGRPVLIGASRKRFLGELTSQDVHDREAATVGASLAAVAGGANMVRVHDVGMTRAALQVFFSRPGRANS